MVALAFGERYPERVGQLIVIGAADRAHPHVHRLAQRAAAHRALRARRAAAPPRASSWRARSPWRPTAAARSSRRASRAAQPRRRGASCSRSRTICWRAAATTRRATGRSPSCACPNPSICIGSMRRRIFVPTSAVAVREDQLVPVADMRALAARLPARDGCTRSPRVYGHDAFLKEARAACGHLSTRASESPEMSERHADAVTAAPCAPASRATTRPAPWCRRST